MLEPTLLQDQPNVSFSVALLPQTSAQETINPELAEGPYLHGLPWLQAAVSRAPDKQRLPLVTPRVCKLVKRTAALARHLRSTMPNSV